MTGLTTIGGWARMSSILRISSASSVISCSFGASAIVAVITNVITLIPMISGSRNASALAPPIGIAAPSGE